MLVTSYVNGSTAGSPPPPRDHSEDAKRGAVKGWTADSVRRHTKWLYAVDSQLLDGLAVAFTLTVRHCPETADGWKRARERFWQRVRDAGLLERGHWLTEWQRRRVPHMHGIVYVPLGWTPARIGWPASMPAEVAVEAFVVGAWLKSAAEFAPGLWSQDAKRVDGVMGWLQYLSKHAARGVRHYQRWGSPAGWEKTGRLWGHLGGWPVIAPARFDMAAPTYHRFRRLMRARRIADARAALRAAERADDLSTKTGQKRLRAARRRLSHARRMLACNDPKLSYVRGVSDWIPEGAQLELLGLLLAEGHTILERTEAA